MTAIARANNSSSFMKTPDLSPPRVLPSEYKNSYPSSDSNLASRYPGYGSDIGNGHTKGQDQSMAASRLNGRDRKFPCSFSFAGCKSEFGRQAQWQQHLEMVHFHFESYECLACHQNGNFKMYSHIESFKKHLRQAHGYSREYVLQCVKGSRRRRRQPPLKMSCPAKECVKNFCGIGAWDDWAKHVWTHIKLGHEIAIERNTSFINYSVDAGIIMQGSNSKYRLCR
ncbi:hypothetical protein BBO_09200 [Beauveria brongniartii RCEF 3172]|uniref:C2H2-type domain-containing protein n=1 Tax=Beauveria brongniartii RCEF 3172 TaxID=1081107 RepID=A0A166W7Q1_9HYPO|nr:hypothetical protein BBO_09200 [Beauveria brongniartii RCEF 3172]